MLRHFNVSVILVSMMLIKLYWVCSCIKNLLHQLGNYFVVLLSHRDASSCLIRHFLEDALQTFTQTAPWALLHAHWAALNRPDPQKMHYRDCDVLPSVAAFFALRFIPQAIFNHFFMSNQSIWWLILKVNQTGHMQCSYVHSIYNIFRSLAYTRCATFNYSKFIYHYSLRKGKNLWEFKLGRKAQELLLKCIETQAATAKVELK